MSVPSRIRHLRRKNGLTLEALAGSVGIHKGHLSRIETGEKAPSLATLEAIARALRVGMAELFGEKANEHEITVVRQSERITTGDAGTYLIEALIAGSASRPLASYIVVPGRTFLDHDVPDHVGQEFLYVLQGRVEVAVADQLITLSVGDCATYDAALQHRLRRLGSAVAKVLVVLGKN
ncbi:helix-turn-helix domain-containing protein [Silvibacterium acidisoli]|uniref:helix-turn-helix domain-containing protein n=1 Tax=Acidobacteriaceae bacterium ZG23-2 TaxID=2883246 RepID=UPI00406D0543